jgi:oxygen-independent coproporphyrinogen III oxidase
MRYNAAMQPVSLYVHLPFCLRKCSYCDLNAYAGLNELIPTYIAALIDEVRQIGRCADSVIHTLYFGGGTPSVTPLPLLTELFAAIRESFNLAPDCEISFEANPETLDEAYLAGLKSLGVNRLSIGAQSAQPNELTLFQRTHLWADVETAMKLARGVRFENISLDLIYGIPGQTMQAWQETLQKALALNPDHFSVYALSADFNTPMRAWLQRGLLAEPDDDLVADMYAYTDATLAAEYGQYEISTWARRSNNPVQFECRHNLQYWRNLPYLGLGAGAHGSFGGVRYANISNPASYVSRIKSARPATFPFSSAHNDSIEIDRDTEMKETLLTGLRLTQYGISINDFLERFGVTPQEAFPEELAELEARHLIEQCDNRIRLSPEGRFVSNWVFEKFV